jgi:hypothetical protein
MEFTCFPLRRPKMFRNAVCRTVISRKKPRRCNIEPLEPRTLLSESASAEITLVSTTGTQANPVFNYAITVTDTGTTNLGTFWFSWLPDVDFLPSVPSNVTSPTGWGASITGTANATDGSAIEWVASSNPITPGHSLSGFGFSSPDSPTVLAGNSPTHPGTPILDSFVYIGAPFSDVGAEVTVTQAASTAASSTTLMSSAPTINVGDSVTFTATVAPANGSGPDPTGTVTFVQDGNTLGTMPVQSNGTAVLTTSSLPAGTLSITAQYGGDMNYSSSTSTPITETVNQPVGTSPTTIDLSPSSTTPAANAPVTFTATVSPTTPGGGTPTGTVTFFIDGTSAGQTALVNGVAQMSLKFGVGSHAVTANYSGDATFAATTTSNSVTETVTAVPTISGAITRDTLPDTFVPGDRGVVTLQLTNSDTTLARGSVGIVAFLTPDGVPADGTPILLPPIFSNMPIAILPNGGVRNIPMLITVPAGVQTGTEQLVLTVAAVSGVTADQVAPGPIADSTPRQATLGFGTVGARGHVMLTQGSGAAMSRFILSGPGTGTLIPDGVGGFSLSLTGTTAASSAIILAPVSVGLKLDSITDDSAIGQLIGRGVNVSGNIGLDGGARIVLLNNITNSTITIGGATPLTALLGNITDSSVQSAAPITTMLFNSWTNTGKAQSLIAPSIRVLLDKGSFAGNIATTGSIATLLIRGDLTGDILAGASFGADNQPGGGNDTFAAASITTLLVKGNVTGSIIGAGLSVDDDVFPLDGNDSLLAGSSIRTLLISGTLSDDSRVLSASLPTRARIGGATVMTAGDTRFSL